MAGGGGLVVSGIVTFDQVVKMYGSKKALGGLTVEIPEGQITGVLGENGAGKSTMFKLIVNLERPTSGEVRVFGQKPGWKQNERIAYLSDRARWYPHHRVRDAIEYCRVVYPGFRPEKAAEYAGYMKLDPSMKVAGMSKGQEARLQLALCLAREADLTILDEPFSGIDLISREKIVELIIGAVSERKTTLLISTHDIHEVEGLFDRVLFIKDGTLVHEVDAEELRAQTGSIKSAYRRVFE
jgi:ABC-2 type transport system ATP-binding protein